MYVTPYNISPNADSHGHSRKFPLYTDFEARFSVRRFVHKEYVVDMTSLVALVFYVYILDIVWLCHRGVSLCNPR